MINSFQAWTPTGIEKLPSEDAFLDHAEDLRATLDLHEVFWLQIPEKINRCPIKLKTGNMFLPLSPAKYLEAERLFPDP